MVRAREKIYDSEADLCPEFFKVFIPHHSSHQLLFPPAFQKHLTENVPKQSAIVGRGNQSWIVNLEREGSNLFFKEGWQEFAKDNHLEVGDFLVFKYDGSSSFSVKIFGRTACAKELNIAANGNKHSLYEQKQEESEVLCNSREASADIYGKRDESMGSETIEKPKRSRPWKENRQVFRASEHERRLGKNNRFHENNAEINAAGRCISKYPSFRKVLKPAYVHGGHLSLPFKFVRAYIKGESRYINLKVSNRLWPVKMIIYGTYCKLTAGWAAFASVNNLVEGDVCIFELINLSCVTFKVSIFRH
ncbi:hypothetical protein Ancab_026051 [Ancistrocladus abbreviatus]